MPDLDRPLIDVTGELAFTSTTSKGNQEKWFLHEKGLFVKAPFEYDSVLWKDYTVEELAYRVGAQLGFDIAEQYMCRIRDVDRDFIGSCSVNFLMENEQHITFYRLLQQYRHTKFSKDFDLCSTEDRIKLVLEIYEQYCKLDASEYLWQMIVMDLLLANEDRHFNNFGVTFNAESGIYTLSKLFDFGLGLFEHDNRYTGLSLDLSIRKIKAKPFNVNPMKAYEAASRILGRSVSGTVDLSGCVFPSTKGNGYFMRTAKAIGLTVTGECEYL